MVNVADVIGAPGAGGVSNGILRSYEVVDIAAQTGLWLPYACAMLKRESYGGRNLWGSDGVATGGAYVKGSIVTKEAYLRYRDLRNSGLIGNQGVGPGQLTARGYQDQADALGGCWDWRCNVTVAFRALSDLVRVFGVDGIRRYNGSGPNAENYRAAVVADAARWDALIRGADPVPTSPPPPRWKGEEMIIRMANVAGLPDEKSGARVGILSGGILIGLSGAEKSSALASGAPIVDVFVETWDWLAQHPGSSPT